MRSYGKPRSEWALAVARQCRKPEGGSYASTHAGLPFPWRRHPEGFAFCGRCGASLPSAPEAEERRVITMLSVTWPGSPPDPTMPTPRMYGPLSGSLRSVG
jgi:hypothetical protein